MNKENILWKHIDKLPDHKREFNYDVVLAILDAMQEYAIEYADRNYPISKYFYDCVICVNDLGLGILLKSFPSLHDALIFEGMYLNDNIYNINDIPTELGIYKCIIEVCILPDDDVKHVLIKDVIKIEVNELS